MKFTMEDVESKTVSFPTYAVISVGSINFRRVLAMRVFDNRMEAERFAGMYRKGTSEVVRISGIEFEESPLWGGLDSPITKPVEPSYPKEVENVDEGCKKDEHERVIEDEVNVASEAEEVPDGDDISAKALDFMAEKMLEDVKEPQEEEKVFPVEQEVVKEAEPVAEKTEAKEENGAKGKVRKSNSKYILCMEKGSGNVIRVYASAGEATRAMGKKGDYVGKICRGEKVSTCEFDFKFAGDLTDEQKALIVKS